MREIIYSKCSTNRWDEYRIFTRIIFDYSTGVKIVEKEAIDSKSNYPCKIYDNYIVLKEKMKGFKFPKCYILNNVFVSDYVEGPSLESLIESANNEEERLYYLKLFFRSVYNSLNLEFLEDKSVLFYISDLSNRKITLYSLDLSFANLIYFEGDLYLIDYEWVDENSVAEFSLYRTFLNSEWSKAGTYFKDYFRGEKLIQNREKEERYAAIFGHSALFPMEARMMVEEIQKQNKELTAQVQLLNTNMEAIINSKSWRITKPLRLLTTKIRKHVDQKR